jgi:hypothetical protein
VGDHAQEPLVHELIAVERSCCPFYELTYEREQRTLTISVSAAEHEPALEAIAYALGLTAETGSSRIARD